MDELRFDVERLEREWGEESARVAALQAEFERRDAAFNAAVKLAFDELAAPWRAMAACIRYSTPGT